mmetsp:Transcript_9247/g.27113  ORF Transcript_9247/g.27113 Transcript_9247/m.27113 type:complete len:350 (-) Transcript_9247:2091-3140(-)
MPAVSSVRATCRPRVTAVVTVRPVVVYGSARREHALRQTCRRPPISVRRRRMRILAARTVVAVAPAPQLLPKNAESLCNTSELLAPVVVVPIATATAVAAAVKLEPLFFMRGIVAAFALLAAAFAVAVAVLRLHRRDALGKVRKLRRLDEVEGNGEQHQFRQLGVLAAFDDEADVLDAQVELWEHRAEAAAREHPEAEDVAVDLRDLDAAVLLVRAAAEAEHAREQHRLGVHALDGRGEPQDVHVRHRHEALEAAGPGVRLGRLLEVLDGELDAGAALRRRLLELRHGPGGEARVHDRAVAVAVGLGVEHVRRLRGHDHVHDEHRRQLRRRRNMLRRRLRDAHEIKDAL